MMYRDCFGVFISRIHNKVIANFNTKKRIHKCTSVWYGMTSGRIIGSYFFEDDNERTETVTEESYRKFIQESSQSEMEDADLLDLWFLQDGTPEHTA